ncbi:putative pentatricopeptide repeat-containing protein At5g08310, mitochondrial [Morus notabilis]|uniref:putative pentatricopeptide repeat-containing protein At5g08310, mitochondrial n=1 Tax=Morus notabilis TaxID=981085 RepID=UPI000CED3ADB|nr:putative pentatricopeptide repeat-containing protein At5g08310, mitochondrial [Morus notabilis]
MALPRILNTHRSLCKLMIHKNPINPTSQSHSPYSTNFSNGLSLSSEQTQVGYDLISIFTKQPFPPDNPELKKFAPILTTKLVELVLNGLKSWKTAFSFFTWASNQSGYRHNCYTYNAMASILSNARQNAPLRALALDVVNLNCLMTPGGLGFFLRCLGSLGLVKEANILFDQVRTKGLCVPNAYSYACLFEVISKSGGIDLLEMRLKEMMDSGLELDKYTLTPLLMAYCKVGKFDKALDVFNEMFEKKWVDAHVFSILVVSFSKWAKVDKAFELIGAMEDHSIRMNEKTFRVLINGFVKESRVDRALQLFSKMRESGLGVDVSLYDVLIGGFCKNNEVEKALCLFSEMKQLGIRPDVRILIKIVSCCSNGERVISLLEETVEDMGEDDVILLYNSVLKCLVNMGSIDKAHFLLCAMMGGESNAAFEVNNRLNINVRPVTSCFRIVIDGLLKTDKLEESYELLRDMEDSGLEPTQFTHNSLYGCLSRREDVAGAFHMVKRMRMRGHKPWIKYSTLLVKQLCKHGKVVEACNFLHDMLQEGFLPDIVAYSAALNGLVKTQDVDSALRMFKEICAQGCCPDVVAYNILINGLCKATRMQEAEDVVNEMLVKGLVPTVVTYNLLIDGWCKIGDIGRAMEFLSRMLGEKIEPSVITYTTLIDGLCAVGQSNDALMLLDDMRRKGCAPNRITLTALINGLCKCGRPDTALVYLHEMEEMGMKPDNFVFIALVSAFLSVSNQPMAFEILQEMVDAGSVTNQLEDRSSSSVKALIGFPTINISDSRDEERSEV